MYQFYYANQKQAYRQDACVDDVRNHFEITTIRPSMWEEHCLECSAPLCYQNCLHYAARSDGRCKRFENGFWIFPNDKACCGQGVHIQFRTWANMMTIVFPAMMSLNSYQKLHERNQKLGKCLKAVADSKLPTQVRWEIIRTAEYLRRRKLRANKTAENKPDAFVFHGFSYTQQEYNLIIEIYDDHTPVYKTALLIHPGENLYVLNQEQLAPACWTPNYLVKVYPENDIEAEIDILWCDFVCGKAVCADRPAEQVKCVVWDLDNTVWDGTLLETDDPRKLSLKAGVLDTIRELDRRGILQSIASKNDREAAWPVVEQLGIGEYFLYPQIHWNAKSGSMEQIAKSLNIGIDALALIDDSAFERKQVRSEHPQVRTYDAAELPGLLQLPEFAVMATAESKNRRAMYRAEEKRNELMSQENQGTVEFLKKCHLAIQRFNPEREDQIRRCYELVVRTNQLNMSGMKYSEEEFTDVLRRPEHQNFAFSCRDDFGEYGIVGFGQYRVEQRRLIFTEFAMSCRVAGKYVESALFSDLLEKEACDQGIFEVHKTKKNALLRRTLEDIGFTEVSSDESKVLYHFSAQLKHRELVSCSEYGDRRDDSFHSR